MLVVLCVALAGCGLADWLTGVLFKPTPASQRAPVFIIEGDVRIGPPVSAGDGSGGGAAGNLAGNAGGGLAGNAGASLAGSNPLNNSNPLAGIAPLTNGNPFASVTPLANVTPLAQEAGLANSNPYRVQAGTEAAIFVEAVDPTTGDLARRERADGKGHYKLQIADARKGSGLIIQATALSQGKVTGFLAAPLPAIRAGSVREVVDISPGSTVVVFTAALAAGVRTEFSVETGFRGFKAPQLGAYVKHLDAEALRGASAKIDAAPKLAAQTTFDALLDRVVGGAAVMAEASGKVAAEAGQSLAHVVAAGNLLLREVARRDAGTEDLPAELVAASAREVKVADVVSEAQGLLGAAGDAAKLGETAAARKDPVLTRLIPANGGPGSLVRIEGAGFGTTAVPEVTIGAASVPEPRRIDEGTLEFAVPPGARSGDVVVKVHALASNALPFRVLGTLSLGPTFDLLVGGSAQVALTATDAEGTPVEDPAIAWRSGEPAIATVAAGRVTALATGDVAVQATSGDLVASTGVHAFSVAGIDLWPGDLVLTALPTDGSDPDAGFLTVATLSAAVRASDRSDRGVAWLSSAPDLLAVDASGTVRAGRSDEDAIVVVTAVSVDDPTRTATVGIKVEAVGEVSVGIQ